MLADMARSRSWSLKTAILSLTVPWPALGATYYVSPSGDDAQSGEETAPFRSMSRAQQAASAGDIVYFRSGNYPFTSGSAAEGIVLNKSGNASGHIQYFAYPGEKPVLDFSGMTASVRIKGISVTGSYIHLKGFEIHGVRQNTTTLKESWGIHVNGGDDNVFENLDVHDIMGPGIFIEEGGNNLVLNCDAHDNYDENSYDGGATPGENADGFGCHSSDPGNVFRGCRAWQNSDDGFDFINSPGVCVVERSFAFSNGFVPGTTTPIGNGAGIKAGGFTNNVPATIPRHRALFNVSFGNRRQGFYANHHEGGIDWINNTAFDNGQRNYDMLADEGPAPHYLRNNIAFGSGGTIDNLNAGEVDSGFNSWELPIQVSAAEFASVAKELALAPRQADGSLPSNGFARPAEGSAIVDQGEEQPGFAFIGAAPDLGAFEFGEANAGSGGTAGQAGSAGAAGAGMSGAGGAAGQAGGNGGGSGSPAGGTAGDDPIAGSAGQSAGGGAGTAAGGAGGSSAGTGNGGSAGVPGAGGSSVAAGGSGATSSGGASQAGAGNAAGAAGNGGSAGGDDVGDDSGCACSVPSAQSEDAGRALLGLGMLLSFGLWSRRRR